MAAASARNVQTDWSERVIPAPEGYRWYVRGEDGERPLKLPLSLYPLWIRATSKEEEEKALRPQRRTWRPISPVHG